MHKIKEDFISKELREYRFKMGTVLASALSGFIAGVTVASVFWVFLFIYYRIVAGFGF